MTGRAVATALANSLTRNTRKTSYDNSSAIHEPRMHAKLLIITHAGQLMGYLKQPTEEDP